MINLNNILSYKVMNILRGYNGRNPYINKLKKEYLRNGKVSLTETQNRYILDNEKKNPIELNKVITIAPYLGEVLKEKHQISFTPEKIFIAYYLGETEKSYHVLGKLKKNQKELVDYWLPKTQVLEDLFFTPKTINVDFSKYDEILKNKKGYCLYDHQKEGINFLLSRDSAILAYDMGMGKSITSIVAAIESGSQKVLIICPSSAKINWKREILTFSDDVEIIDGSKWKDAKFTIINYDILKNFHTPGKQKKGEEVVEFNRHMVRAGFDLCIIDEAHTLKNPSALKSKIINDYVNKYYKKNVWLLSGTPITNRPMDYYNLLKLVKSPIAENWLFYAKRYCAGKKLWKTKKDGKKQSFWVTSGSSNLDELFLKSKTHVLRKLLQETIDMPEKLVIPMYYSLNETQKRQYDSLWGEYLVLKNKKNEEEGLTKDLIELGLLRKFVALEMTPNTIELVEKAIENNKKVIVFTTFTDELMELQEYFGNKCVIHYGGLSQKEKQNSIDKFQNNNKVKIFIGNIKSAGVAITLTEASVVIFNSYEWVPGWNEQAENRAFRIGQKNNVTIYYQLFEDTVSIRVRDVLQNKQMVISKTVDGIENTEINKWEDKSENEIIEQLMLEL